MIRLSYTANGFTLYDYKNATYCNFKQYEEAIKIYFGTKIKNSKIEIEIENDDDERFVSIIEKFFNEQIELKLFENHLSFIKDNKNYKISLLNNNQVVYSIKNANTLDSISKLINEIKQTSLASDEVVSSDFNTYFANRDLWFNIHFSELNQSEEAYIISIFRELYEIEKDAQNLKNAEKILNSLKYVKKDLETIESAMKNKEKLVIEELNRKTQKIKELKLLNLKK